MEWYHRPINSKHRATVRKIFQTPARNDITWSEVESLMNALDVDIDESGRGSRCKFRKYDDNGKATAYMSLHKPHNPKTFRKSAVADLREFLEQMEVTA